MGDLDVAKTDLLKAYKLESKNKTVVKLYK